MGPLLPLEAWVRNQSLRSWPVLIFLLLIAIPPLALVVFYNNPGTSSFDEAAWILAAYFALAWLLLIGVIVRPAGISLLLLNVVVVMALITQVPLAITLEKALHSGSSNVFISVGTIGVPEELAKAIPIIVIALIARRRLLPADYLFLGAVSGLVFGASEAEHYIASGVGIGPNATADLVATLSYVWRFPTDPIQHACWAGITGYFIGLAVSGRYKWWRVCWVGLVMASVLHGLNDWNTLNGHYAWVAIIVLSGLLFLTYAKADPPAVAARKESAARPGPGPTGTLATTRDIQAELDEIRKLLPGQPD
jgi:RsiW-degrading membrane proteinase PrsW (M82 family)